MSRYFRAIAINVPRLITVYVPEIKFWRPWPQEYGGPQEPIRDWSIMFDIGSCTYLCVYVDGVEELPEDAELYDGPVHPSGRV